MKAIFNDATELVIQSADIQSDGSLLIKTIQISEEELKTIFSDEFKTTKITVSERMSTLGVYERYSKLEAIVKYTAGILGVILYKVEETPKEKAERLEQTTKKLEETIETLKKDNEKLSEENEDLKEDVKGLKESNETLLGCVLEMSEVVYQ